MNLNWLFQTAGPSLVTATIITLMIITGPGRVMGQSGTVEIKKTDGGFLFLQNGSAVLKYQKKPISKNRKFERNNYVHPLYDFDGNILTEDFPDDHLHHRGIFWAWHQVLVDGKTAGDSWLAKNFSWQVNRSRIRTKLDGSATLTNEVEWLSSDILDARKRALPIVKEVSAITVYPAKDETRAIDFEIRLWAIADKVSIGGSDDRKGYGGFSTRLAMPDDLAFHGPLGQVEPQLTAVESEGWLDYRGTFGRNRSKSGIAIMVHPKSDGAPQRWILRAKSSMQNPVFPGPEPIKLSHTKPVLLRYRLLIHKNVLTHKQLTEAFDQYSNLSSATSTTEKKKSAK